ncbi:tyrosine--tRNA ligase, partial [Candidatus Uhrbacteria bacterium]|nr:tyrosine--tRNA ligase [Candidatus Uhrbacteria bacterium]
EVDELLTRGVEEVIERAHLREALLSGRRLRIKLGIDPTSPKLHIGRAIPLRKLRAFQDLGHQVVFIVGDFTGIIGDTSDKEAERPMLSEQIIKENITTYFKQAAQVLDGKKAEMHYNSSWLKKLGFAEVGRMADAFGLHEFEARENIAKRLKAGSRVSVRELLYPLMQGYDSVAVKADVEVGGTDQKFNLLAGRAIQKLYGQEPQDIMTFSLLEGLDGRKMSSSWGNTVNLTDEPNEMFGKIMSLKDELVERYFSLCTDLEKDEIAARLQKGPRDAKLALAHEIVRLYHGEKEADRARDEFIKVFSEKRAPTDVPEVTVPEGSYTLIDLLVAAKLAQSRGEARRLIVQGGVKVNGKRKNDPAEKVAVRTGTQLQVGPRRFLRLLVE